MSAETAAREIRPTLPERPCPTCGASLEPLRAGEVLLFEDGFRFLCNLDCRVRYLNGERDHDAAREQARVTRSRPAPPGPSGRHAAIRTPRARKLSTAPPRPDRTAGHRALANPRQPPPWIGLGAAALGLILGLSSSHPIVGGLAVLSMSVAAAYALHVGWPSRPDVGWLGWALPPTGALLAAIAAVFRSEPEAGIRWWVAGAAFASGAVVVRAWLDARSSQPVADVVGLLSAKMPTEVRVPVRTTDWNLDVESERVPTDRVRTGQEIVVAEGEVAAVDGVVQAGDAFALLHPASRTPVRRGPGDPLLAGAQVTEGAVRVLATRVGQDRALVRPTRFGEPEANRSARLTVIAHRVTRWGGVLTVVGAAVSLLLTNDAAAAAAVMLAVPLVAIRRASEAPYVAAAATAAERGISFSSAHSLDRAGRATVAALCTHGTITEGEPEVVEVHAIGSASWQPLLALAAGAEGVVEEHPIARAVIDFCKARSIEPEAVRRATFVPGRGVTAVSPKGEELVVGSRALLLEEGVSVAVADDDAARSEERGHTVVFIGLDGRVGALLSLRDEDRLGARAAMQRLIDLSIEIVLISGDHRGTVESLAQRLDITHVKAELLPDERRDEVRRLREDGGVVAAIGRAGYDDAALSGADVPVVLGAAGLPEGEDAVSLTGDDVRDAAAALWLARAARRAAWRGTMLAGIGGGVLLTAAALGIANPFVAAAGALAIDFFALPSAARLLRRVELRLPARG